jgi:hypothetical protein
LTSLTLDEFQLLVPPFEAAFQAHRFCRKVISGKDFTVIE